MYSVAGLWELLYADDLDLTAETLEGEELMFNGVEAGFGESIEDKLGEDKMMVTGGEREAIIQIGRYACGLCFSHVGAKSVMCRTCGKWYHKRCSFLRSLSTAAVSHFQCVTCA